MGKITNSSQQRRRFIYGAITLIILEFIILYIILNLKIISDTSIGYILFYLVMYIIIFFNTRAIFCGIVYFIPKEECYIKYNILVYERILFNKVLKRIDIPLKNILKIEDKGRAISHLVTEQLNPIHYLINFNTPYFRINIKCKYDKKYKLFIDMEEFGRRRRSLPLRKFWENFFKGPPYKDSAFLENFNNLKNMIEKQQEKLKYEEELKQLAEKYKLEISERYNYILKSILEEEKIFLYPLRKKVIVNSNEKAIKSLKKFRRIKFEEINFYVFYVNYLSKKEYENQKVLVGYNGIDAKEVTFGKLKEDINLIRDNKINY